jgi:hypothetical protein
MTTATLNERTTIVFPVKGSEGKRPQQDGNSEDYGNFVNVTSRLLSVSKGEAMTREIESDPAEAAALRRARAQVRNGRVYRQDELDKRIADDG